MSEPPAVPKKKRSWKCLQWTIVILVAMQPLLGIAFVVFVYYYVEMRIAAMGREASQVLQEDLPIDAEGLHEFYHVSEELDRRGDKYVEAFARYVTTFEKIDDIYYSDRFGDTGSPHSAEDVAAIQKHLDANAEYMRELRLLLNRERDVRFPMDLWVGIEVEFPHLSAVREAVRMLAAQSKIYAEAGNPNEVAACLRDSIYVSDLLQHDPLLVPQLVHMATLAIAHNAVENATNAVRLPDDAVSDLKDLATQRNPNGMIAFGLIGERCIMEVPADTEPGLTNIGKVRDLLGRRKNQSRAKQAMNANMFLTLSEMIRIGDLPPWERLPATDRLQRRNARFFGVLHPFDYETAKVLGHAYQAENRSIAFIDTMRVAFGALAFARESGKIPQTLTELVPEHLDKVPLDAFDGQLLRFKRVDDGFVVYSIGDNRKDDGGRPPNEGESLTEDGDVVFRVLDAKPYLSHP